MKVVVLGLSLTSTWGNGHATTYRALLRALARRGHDVVFLERDVPWYAAHRDLPDPPYARTHLYRSLDELERRHAADVRAADLVVVGSYVPEGRAVGDWVLRTATGACAFYDIDTPVTMAQLEREACPYVTPEQLARYDVVFSFAGGPVLDRLRSAYGVRRPVALHCSVDPASYPPSDAEPRFDLGYLGTYSADRQPALDALLAAPARAWSEGRFVVAGPQYPPDVRWPQNVARREHVPQPEHPAFYGSLRFTLNVTRQDMVRTGHAPSVRLFEAAACGVPIVSDAWPGIEQTFRPGEEILLAHGPGDVLRFLREMPEERRRAVAAAGRGRVLAEHTADHRAALVEHVVRSLPEALPEPMPGTTPGTTAGTTPGPHHAHARRTPGG